MRRRALATCHARGRVNSIPIGMGSREMIQGTHLEGGGKNRIPPAGRDLGRSDAYIRGIIVLDVGRSVRPNESRQSLRGWRLIASLETTKTGRRPDCSRPRMGSRETK